MSSLRLKSRRLDDILPLFSGATSARVRKWPSGITLSRAGPGPLCHQQFCCCFSCELPHGTAVPGQCFFLGEKDLPYPWGQGGGINAGVILLQPCSRTFAQMLSEVTSEVHPEHVLERTHQDEYWR